MIEIMDTTLRDGEQTSGVSFAAHEKLSIAEALLDRVNRLEIASARVSDGEFEAVKRVASWAERTGNIQKLEVLGFVDGDVSLNWIEAAGCRVVNLLCKGSYKHVTEQLRKTPEQHFADIRSVINQAIERGIAVNIYLKIGRTVLKTLLNMSFKQSIRFVTCRSGVSCCLIRLAS